MFPRRRCYSAAIAVNKVLSLRLDVAPKVGRHKLGKVGNVACRHDHVSGGDAERQGLGGEDDVDVQLFRVAGRQAALPGRCPEVSGDEHGGAGDWQKAHDGFQAVQLFDAAGFAGP